jgi:bifunctional polynucleotide phosphatase/kinase
MSSPKNITETIAKVIRCPKGTRKNKKTGDCEDIKKEKKDISSPKNATETIAKMSSPKNATETIIQQMSSETIAKVIRCPKGTRKNKKTGDCEDIKKEKKDISSPKNATETIATETIAKMPSPKNATETIAKMPSPKNDTLKVINPLSSYSKKIAAFDLDDTLINTKSGKKLAKEMTDWKLMNDKVKPKLQDLVKKGYSIIIFTNQKGVGKSGKVDEFEDKIKAIKDELNINLTAYVSLKDDYNRKPFPGMFEYHTSQHPIDKTHSFYVGDAYSSVDAFSDSDYKFALNNKIPFYIADNYFNEENPTPYTIPIKSPLESYYGKMDETKLAEINKAKYILLVSPPASGKSTFCEKYLPNHLRLSKDDYASPKLYKNAVKDAVNQDKPIVFDNTHATQKSRDEIISMLPKNAEVLYLVRNIPKDIAMYLNRYRYYTTRNESKYLPDIAIHVWYKNYEEPTGNVIHLPLVIENKIKDVYV